MPLASACDTNVCRSQCGLAALKACACGESSRGAAAVAIAKNCLIALYSWTGWIGPACRARATSSGARSDRSRHSTAAPELTGWRPGRRGDRAAGLEISGSRLSNPAPPAPTARSVPSRAADPAQQPDRPQLRSSVALLHIVREGTA